MSILTYGYWNLDDSNIVIRINSTFASSDPLSYIDKKKSLQKTL